jgi:integrase
MNKAARAALMGAPRKGEYVFSDDNGRRITYFQHAFDRAKKKSDIEDFHFHDLRHTFASYLVMEGVDIMTVKELLGHKTLAMTLRYSHLSPTHKAKAVSVLDKGTLFTEGDPGESAPAEKRTKKTFQGESDFPNPSESLWN